MPIETLRIIPSVDIESTLADNAAGISESSFIRWKTRSAEGSIPEKRGGWSKYINATFAGTTKDLWAWQGLSGSNQLAVGTTTNLYVVANGNITDITAEATTVDIPVDLTTVISTTTVRVDDTANNSTVYDSVVFNTHASVGGVTLFGAYPIVQIASADSYYIDPGVTATSSVSSGGAVGTFTATLSDSILTYTLANHTYAVGDTIAFPVATEVGGISIQGQYLVLTTPTADTLTFNAQNTATAATVTGASGTGATITLTYSGAYTYQIGDTIVVASVNPAGYNGTYTVTAASAGSVSAAGAETAAYVSGGTIFGSVSRENGGQLDLTYYITPAPPITGTGYGEAAYGDGGYGTGAPSPSNSGTPITATDYWLSNWGDALISCPEDGPIFTWSSTTGLGNASIIPTAPLVNAGAFVAMPQQQIMVWGSTYNGVGDPLQVRWCDAGDYTVWTAASTNQAGGYLIPTGSKIVRGLQGANMCFFWTDIDLYVAQYIGTPGIWGFNKAATGCGLIGPKAVGALSSSLFWMSQKQFFVINSGSTPAPLPCSVWDYVFQNMNSSYVNNIRAAPNAQFNEITWYFPSAASTGQNDSYVTYNIVSGDWDVGTIVRTAWIDQSVLGSPIGASTDGYLYQHETSNDADGSAITSYLKTGYFSISNGHDLVFVDWVLPDMKWGTYSGAQTAQLQMSFNVVDYAGDTPITYGPFTISQSTKYIEPRFRGRFVQIIMQSSDLGSFWRLGSVRYRYAPDGGR